MDERKLGFGQLGFDWDSPSFDQRVPKLSAPLEGERPAPQIEPSNNSALFPLTIREMEILEAVANRKRNYEIADQLSISTRTVEKHLQRIFVKLGVKSRAPAALFYHTHNQSREIRHRLT